jgi:methionyl-tRNA formyltransferase
MPTYRALFLGSMDPAMAAAMRGWLSAGHQIAGVWYGLPKWQGAAHRDARYALLAPQWSVSAVARRHDIPIRRVPRLASWPGRLEALRDVGADVLVSVYFPFLVPADMLAAFGDRAVNLHPAPLPRYRGPNPFHAMVLDRSILTDGAMTLHVMTDRFDEGPIIAQRPIKFPPDGSFVRYLLEAAIAGRRLMAEALPAYLDGSLRAVPQGEAGATSYARVFSDELALSSDLSVEDMRLRCMVFARRRAIPVKGMPDIRVAGFDRELGPAGGAPPRIGFLSIDMDARDRRVRLWRKQPWSNPLGKCRDWAAHITTRDPEDRSEEGAPVAAERRND